MRPLSKSRFNLALDCPTKLFYTGKTEYENLKDEDLFMAALAEGGYQVGELAKCYYAGGFNIAEKGYDVPLQKTNKLLEQENVVIFEAAIKFDNFFIRVDVLEKKGNKLKLIEVKAKSFKGINDESFTNNGGYVSSNWSSYLQDVAFQKYVMKKAFPNWDIAAYLMLADKTKKATVNGLNQIFQLVQDKEGRNYVEINGEISTDLLGEQILSIVNVDDIADKIISDQAFKEKPEMSFEEKIHLWAEKYKKDEKIISPVGIHCFNCEFNTKETHKKSGFRECWSHYYNWSEEQFNKPKIKEIWNFAKKSKLFEEGKIFVDELNPEDVGSITPKDDGTMSTKERQWMQIEKIQQNNDEFYLDAEGMKRLIDTFQYPLHFIDFETSMVAIPFYKGQSPYEQVAFQFSHHIMQKDGSVAHVGEFIERVKGKFPNFDFIRALKKELENDNGTVFRYATHENSVLNQISAQLLNSNELEVEDKEDLMEFINTITYSNKEGRKGGDRVMVDMLQMVRQYFYDPRMGGSNSIKAVLPAVLSRSKYIQEKYSNPIYGKNSLIKSLNFNDGWIWIRKNEKGELISPYKILPPLFQGIDSLLVDEFITNEDLADGGAAMTAFSKMQFARITDLERDKIIEGLLKYCELDTLAMVLIFEFWLSEIGVIK